MFLFQNTSKHITIQLTLTLTLIGLLEVTKIEMGFEERGYETWNPLEKKKGPYQGAIRVWNQARRKYEGYGRDGRELLYVNRLSRPGTRERYSQGSRPGSRGSRPSSREQRPSSRDTATPPRTGTPTRIDRMSTPPRTVTPTRGVLGSITEDGLGDLGPLGCVPEEGSGDVFGLGVKPSPEPSSGREIAVEEAYPPGMQGTPMNPWGGGFGLGQTQPLPGQGRGLQSGVSSIMTPLPGMQRRGSGNRSQTAVSSPTVVGATEDIRTQLAVLPSLGFSADVRSATVPRGSRGHSRQSVMSRGSNTSMGFRLTQSFRQRQNVHETYNELQFHKNIRKQHSIQKAVGMITDKSTGFETVRVPFSLQYGGTPQSGRFPAARTNRGASSQRAITPYPVL